MMKQKKIGVLSSSRADYGIYINLLKYWKRQKWIEVEVIIFGSHLLAEMKSTLDLIEKDSFGLVRVVGDFVKTKKTLILLTNRQIYKNYTHYEHTTCDYVLDIFENCVRDSYILC